MTTKEEADAFLKDFKTKMRFWDVLFRDDRSKNAQTLADLELRPIDRKKILEGLKVEDYCEGPIEDTIYGASDLWVFGHQLASTQIYIKISIGIRSSQVICISFHQAEHEMTFPLKMN